MRLDNRQNKCYNVGTKIVVGVIIDGKQNIC
jgi:hypothetical protein